jgi:hypothetical protein
MDVTEDSPHVAKRPMIVMATAAIARTITSRASHLLDGA